MALTGDFKATVQARVQADPAFREALLREGIETLLSGDVDTGKAILRDYIKATVGFEKLGADRLQRGETITLPHSRPMLGVGAICRAATNFASQTPIGQGASCIASTHLPS